MPKVITPTPYRLYNEDCFQTFDRIEDKSIDLVLCDLPYGTTRNKWDTEIPLEPLWDAYRRICKPGAAIVLTAQTPFDKVLGASNLKMLKYEWIWHKTRATGHLNVSHSPMKNHENVLIFYSEIPTYHPQGVFRRPTPLPRKGGSKSSNYGKSDQPSISEFENYPRTILTISSEGDTDHPTQKPIELMAYFVRTYTNPGDLVLDNCMGSGTTGVACMNHGRRFIGVELDTEHGYFPLAENRIREAWKQSLRRRPLFDQILDTAEVA